MKSKLEQIKELAGFISANSEDSAIAGFAIRIGNLTDELEIDCDNLEAGVDLIKQENATLKTIVKALESDYANHKPS